MRVIAGEFRGRKLLGPETEVTRPVTDRVKQSLFDILSPYLAGARVYDCFAGTGSMGLECLSRGAAQVTFFEADRSALVRLKKNIGTLGVQKSSCVIAGDLFAWFQASTKPVSNVLHKKADLGKSGSAVVTLDTGSRVDLVFLDPPYRFLHERPNDLQRLAESLKVHMSVEGIVVFRHDANDALAFPALPAADVRSYGSMTLEFLRPDSRPATNNPPPTTDN